MTEGDLNAVRLGMLRHVADNSLSLEARIQFVQSQREDEAASRQVDEALIRQLSTQREALNETRGLIEALRAKQAELAEALEKLTSPPLHEAVFLGMERSSGRELAKVAFRGERRLVSLDEDLLGEGSTLDVGDVVHLAQGHGVIVGKAGEANPIGETATVQRRLSPGRIMLRDRDADVVVQASDAVRRASVEPGDQLLWNRAARLAVEKISVSETHPQFVRVEEIEDEPPRIGGMDSRQRRVISLFTSALTNPALARRYGLDDFSESALLVGPPGCGKTLLARTIAYLITKRVGVPCRFAVVNGAELESQWVGETQRNIRTLFKALTRGDGPAILYIDELEAIGRHRGAVTGFHADRFLSQWLTSLDGFRRREDVAVLASTNRKDLVDPALLQRLSSVEIPVGRPSRDAATEIFDIHLPDTLPFAKNGHGPLTTRDEMIQTAVSRLYDPNAGSEVAVLRFRDGTTRTVASRELISGRVIEQICRSAQQRAFEREAELQVAGLELEDMEEAVADAMEKLSTTLSARNVRNYLTELSEDQDVVAVEPVRRKVRRHRYMVRGDR